MKNLNPNSTWVDLAATQVTNLSPLKRLTKLECLWLNQTPVTDLSPLEDLTNLEDLFLRFTSVTNLSPLKNLMKLRFLDLRNNAQVIDLSPLKDLALEKLLLTDTKITDFSPLEELNSLRWLHLDHIAKAKVQKLHKALPDCYISWGCIFIWHQNFKFEGHYGRS